MRVLIIGDIIIDKYIYGTSTRLSPEAPVPVITHERTEETLGGAGLVYKNLKSLGVDVELYDAGYKKSVKTRVMCDGHYVTRIDDDFIVPGDAFADHIMLIDFSEFDYVILSDYNKGTLDYAIDIIAHINKFDCKVIVDPKRHVSHYDGAWLVKPNRKEYKELEFESWTGNIITTGDSNPVLADIEGNKYFIEMDPIEVADVTGAGDCFLAAFVYGLTRDYDYKKCLELAIQGARTSIVHSGTYILKQSDLEERVIFTNGVFDILHKGHFELLNEARSLGDKLIVGINSDASVKRLKGETRPINNQIKRISQLEILPWVDQVVVFDEDTPYELIKQINPHVIVKGGDYTVEQVVGHDLADVHIVKTVEGYSTTKIIEASK
jgi:D-beta-D-heptose 7-phosphate kinase/D-beta-D-heptose 1-phosphate adenosyltransferase